jgi:hypothetical protein
MCSRGLFAQAAFLPAQLLPDDCEAFTTGPILLFVSERVNEKTGFQMFSVRWVLIIL